MMQNNLFLVRLRVITMNNEVAYDEKFHKGINIIRGHNSSGKSTITHLIFFVLGGYYSNFVPEVFKCMYVMAEVEINGAVITIKRPLERLANGAMNPNASMYIFFGDMETALSNTDKDGWQCYGYKMSAEKKSFSNVLFEMLGLPIMKADSNITMHQILRLMYLDQESPTGSLFFFDTFDKEIIRETTSDLLLGVYNEDLSQAKLELIEIERSLSYKKGEVKIANDFLSHPTTRSSKLIQDYIDSCIFDITKLTQEIEQARKSTILPALVQPNYTQFQKQIAELRQKKFECESAISKLHADINDSRYFIYTLEKKLKSLENSIETRSYLDRLPLEYCPDCLTKLDSNVPAGHCRLCKSPIDNSRGKAQAFRIKLEVEFQIKESKKLLSEDEQDLKERETSLKVLSSSLSATQTQLDNAMNNVQSTKDDHIDQLIQTRGFKEGEILQYRTLLEQALRYESLLSEVGQLNKRAAELKGFIRKSEIQVDAQRNKINGIISKAGAYLLSHDEERQAEFKEPSSFVVDFKQNQMYINERNNKFSASSAFYLKLSARFAILIASIYEKAMVYPRFMFADNMEDKGLEVERARNFQHLIVRTLMSQRSLDYQVIYATSTSFIPDDLNVEPYVVGECYTENNKSLKYVN